MLRRFFRCCQKKSGQTNRKMNEVRIRAATSTKCRIPLVIAYGTVSVSVHREYWRITSDWIGCIEMTYSGLTACMRCMQDSDIFAEKGQSNIQNEYIKAGPFCSPTAIFFLFTFCWRYDILLRAVKLQVASTDHIKHFSSDCVQSRMHDSIGFQQNTHWC